MKLTEMCELVRPENAEIVILDEQVARVGHYSDFYCAFGFIDDELHSLNCHYQQQHLYFWEPETRRGTATGTFRGEGYRAQELIFFKRYASTPNRYEVAETLYLAPGGDPRFVTNETQAFAVHIVSDGTYWLHNLRTRKSVRVTLPLPREKWGKNWQPFLAGDELFIVHEMEPFRIIKLHEDGHGELVRETAVDFNMPCTRSIEPRNYPMFRGGCNALSIGGSILGSGRATSIGYRHSPFFWSFDEHGHFEIAFNGFFSEFHRQGFRIIDPTCVFFHDDDLYLGCCATETFWQHTQRVLHLLLVFPSSGQVDENRSLIRHFERENQVDGRPKTELDRSMFICPEMPGDTNYAYEHAGRLSMGEPGNLVRGPDIEIQAEGRYCAELTYVTLECPGSRAGALEIYAKRRDDDGNELDSKALGRVELIPSHRETREARVQFDTKGVVGFRLEARVVVEEDVRLNAFHVRTWRESPSVPAPSFPWSSASRA